ncbi:unnamed protein product [Rhizophagus irregularis]|nr:unnamed protein product [Rhizophagus irregularis]
MSCSKIFSGDLPELTFKIMKYFQNDYSTLHSCILVNRLWCRLSIPLLWENPFSIHAENYNFIEIYLHSLNDDFITNKYKIINKSSHSNILFNYPRFLKYLNTNEFIFSVDKWYKLVTSTTNSEDIKKLTDICVLLFKIFIENEVNLHTLEIEFQSNYYQTCFGIILDELILKNTNFIHNIRNLNLYNVYNYEENSVIKDRISQMINLRQNLKKILISYRFSLYRSLLLSKDYNCSNTLNTIVFHNVDFKGINNLQKIFEQLNVLKSVHIFYCGSLNTGFTQQIINLTKPFKLKSLFIKEVLQIESLQQLLQKSGDYIENFEYSLRPDPSLNQHLLELIAKYCKNINFLHFNGYRGRIVYQMFNLIENIKQNLNYLIISCINSRIDCSIILQNLGQALPSKLECMSFSLTIKGSDFRFFLENSQDTFINKLLIVQNGSEDILHYTKEYIMKERRVKYLAIKNTTNRINLFDLKDEVKEFKLHNIIVRYHNDLFIDIMNYIKNID